MQRANHTTTESVVSGGNNPLVRWAWSPGCTGGLIASPSERLGFALHPGRGACYPSRVSGKKAGIEMIV